MFAEEFSRINMILANFFPLIETLVIKKQYGNLSLGRKNLLKKELTFITFITDV